MILITGAAGFVGRALAARFMADGLHVARWARRPSEVVNGTDCHFGEIGPDTVWTKALQGVEVVVHAAARVHMMKDQAADPLAEHRRINLEGTVRLARQAAVAGVRRFVYLSTVKVHGDSSPSGGALVEGSPIQPPDFYALSKAEAEVELGRIAAETGMDVVVIRPPLVYGPGVKANFQSLITAVQRGMPLPLGAISNQRSLIGISNLVDFLGVCCASPKAAGGTFLVSDGQDMSTPELIRRIGAALGRRPRLLSVPTPVLRLAGMCLGRQAAIDRLTGSLRLDISHARQLLGWNPPLRVEEELSRTVSAFCKT
jgi:nucleoside-diphosphate-sugar epimerase